MNALLPPLVPMSARIAMLEAAMWGSDEKIDIALRHFFAGGLYAREATLPAGSMAIGHTHLKEHICIISKGRCRIVTDDGLLEIAAPATIVVPAGRKNCVHVIDETVWTTIHTTNAATPEEAEAILVDKGDEACRLSQ